MAQLGYACNNCGGFTKYLDWIFPCIECGKELCESWTHVDGGHDATSSPALMGR